MRIIRRILYFILALIVLLCLTVMVCAFNPSLTEQLAVKVTESNFASEESEGETESGTEVGLVPPIFGDGVNLSGTVQSGAGVYIPPAQEDVTSPESVKDLNGYEPVWENGEQIADEDAESIQQGLLTGDVGEDITFDTLFYPYYGMLDTDMQALYRQIYANAMDLTTSFAPVVPVTVDQAKNVFEAVYNDHPELFWLETGYSCKFLQNGQCIELTLQYHRIANDLDEVQEQFDVAAQKIIRAAKELGTDAEKEKYVHDILIDTVDYHAGTTMNQSAYSALVNGRSVCAGYARAFQYVMIKLGIPCYYCTGYSGQNHAWNIVKLDDGYYNVDVTWDDTQPSTCDYFNKTDADYAQTHMRKGLSVYLPACNADKYRKGPDMDSVQSEDEISTDGEETEETEILDPGTADTNDLINQNPQKPLTWSPTVDKEQQELDAWEDALDEAGLTEEEVLDTLEEYYANCLAQMKKVGTGQKQFTNVIPKSLWQTIEKIYSDGSYEKGYVDAALKELKMENFAIQLQTQRLNGTFYRLYHNISTW